ncbi:MAG: MFS transporter [Micromonosporaceae bacterium]|nr:MFS transporter [Micromonosporaceae bacterium]
MKLSNWWDRTSADLPRPFWALVVGTFVNRIGYVVEPFLALYLTGPRRLSPVTVGVVIACFGAGSFASQILGGYLADRYGRRFTLVTGMAGTAACFMLLASVRQLALIAVAATLTGLMIDLYRPALQAAVADLVPAAARPRAFALIYWAINLGVAVSGVLGGLLADRSYWLLFAADAVTCLAFAAVIARAVPETRPEPGPGEHGGYRRVLSDGIALGLFASTVLSSTVYMQQFVTLPLAVRASGLTATAFGLIYAVNPIVVIAAQPLVLRLADRLPVAPTMAVASLVMGLGFALTGFARSIPVFALTVLVWTVGEIAFNAVGPALVAEIAPAQLRGRYNGVIGMAFGASALLGPLLGTRLYGLDPNLLWLACLVTGAASAAVVLALRPAIAHRRRAMAEAAVPAVVAAPDEAGQVEPGAAVSRA